MRTLVFGVLGKFDYNTIKIEIEENDNEKAIYEGTAITALKKHYNADVLLFAPESLITLTEIETANDAERLLKNEREIQSLFESKLRNNMEFDFLKIIPAMGAYPKKSEDFKKTLYVTNFDARSDTIRAIMLLTLLEKLYTNNYDTLILDVSTGFNVYISMLQDVFRDLIVNKKLNTIFAPQNFRTYIAEIPPVIPGVKKESRSYKLNKMEYDVKVFFEFPCKNKVPEIGDLISYGIFRSFKKSGELEERYRAIKSCMSLYKMIFNAIKLNAPLVILSKYLREDLEKSNCLDSNIIPKFIDILNTLQKIWQGNKEVYTNENEVYVKYPYFNATNVRTLFHSVALSDALLRSYKNLLETIKEPTTRELAEKFGEIYENLGLSLNKRFLDRDLRRIEYSINKIPEGWIQLKCVLYEPQTQNKEEKERESGKPQMGSDPKRNFFAHSGLLGEFVYVKRIGDKIYLDYRCQNDYEKIKKWLMDPK